MYQKKGTFLSIGKIFKILFVASIILISGFYVVLTMALGSLNDEFDLFFNGFEVEDSLVEEEHVKYDLLDLRAEQFERLLGTYHIPEDMTGEGWDYYPPVSVCFHYSNPDVKFYNNSQLLATFDPLDLSSPYNNKDNMTYCGDRGHTALYEGVYTAGEAFRYAIGKRNNDNTMMNAAKERILKIVRAYDLISNVSKKSAFVRYAVPNTTKAMEKFPGHWGTSDHYVVEYRGYKWSLSRHLSRDVTIGILFGLSMSYYFVDDPQIRTIAGRIIDKTVQYFHDSNWRIVDTDGSQNPSGDFVSARPMWEGSHVLTFLQMGKMVNPEKWGPVYHHYVYDRGLVATLSKSSELGVSLTPMIFGGYYGCNFLYNNAPTLILMETDPVLREIYIKNWLNVLHDFTKLHRNANFDMVYLLCHSEILEGDEKYSTPDIILNDYDLEIWKEANIENPTDKEYIKNFCVRDIKDALMRYAIRRYPNRDYYWSTTPGTFPNIHQRPIPNFKYPDYDYYNPSDAGTMSIVLGLTGDSIEQNDLLNNALPADMRRTEDIMWQRRSFTVGTTERLTDNPGSFQAPAGPEYLAVYWMAKYLELF